MNPELLDALAWVLPVVTAITFHEVAHGWMARRFGDATAESQGRLSLNPLKHVDRFGTILLPAMLWLAHSPFILGYAKPVPVNFSQLQPRRLGMIAVALAGPGMNIALAIIAGLLLHIDHWITPEQAPWMFENLYRAVMINAVLATFNLLPILPLDGGRVVYALLPPVAPRRIFGKTERLGIVLVLGVLIFSSWLNLDIAKYLITMPAMWMVEQLLWLTGNAG